MRRDRKSSVKKERMIMITSSVFVLAALTMTGLYIKDKNVESQDDGYTIDFTALEDGAEEKYQEIARNDKEVVEEEIGGIEEQLPVTEDDLDYMPLEAGSNLVEIPGLTDGINAGAVNEEIDTEAGNAGEETPSPEPPAETDNANTEANADSPVVGEELHFAESDGLLRPVTGDILMHYSMEGSVYFATLDQYKYNPAVVFSVEEGSQVNACAAGQVVNIFENEEIGHAVTLDLGDGYQATYGQLKDISVTLNSYVEAGAPLGLVATPTKYYSVEGSNLYFQLTKDGVAVNPENLF